MWRIIGSRNASDAKLLDRDVELVIKTSGVAKEDQIIILYKR